MAVLASERAYATLHDEIVSWQLRPGTVLGEVELSARLGVSRTPVREAISRLVADGLATPHGGRGVVVSGISDIDIEQLYQLRCALETRSASLAAERADPAVFAALAAELREAADQLWATTVAEAVSDAAHIDVGPSSVSADEYYAIVRRLDEAIDHAVANPWLLDAQRRMRLHLTRIRRLAQDNPHRLAESALEHTAIAEAIQQRDPELASAATRIHLARALAAITSSARDRTELSTD